MRKLLLLLLLAIFLGGVFIFRELIFKAPVQLEREVPALVEEFKERINAPPPLILEVRFPESFLTQTGIVQWTNTQRSEQGLPPLKESIELNLSAALKTQDMLENQYFAHISPEGQGAGDVAKAAGYEFIAIGENLALGDFENDEKLVQGWMDSPGHRANILSSQYQEIGVAVLKGEFQGRLTWLAVQHFGKPLSACPQPQEDVVSQIMANQSLIEELYYTLSQLQAELQAKKSRREPDYNQKVEEYNALVLQYNSLIEETKRLIEQYNAEVRLFNECAATP